MFILEPVTKSGRVFLSDITQKGIGIDSTLEEVIENTIIYAERAATSCTCDTGNVIEIAHLLALYDDGLWNVFCGASSYLKLDLFVKNDKYIYTKPKNCYYGIYDVYS